MEYAQHRSVIHDLCSMINENIWESMKQSENIWKKHYGSGCLFPPSSVFGERLEKVNKSKTAYKVVSGFFMENVLRTISLFP